MESMATESKNSAGELLKQGRLRQRLSIAECAKRTHIATRFIEALEEERWSLLPSESHRLGFLRLYSRFLGVSVDDVLSLYSQKSAPAPAAKTEAPVEKQKPPEPTERRISDRRQVGWSPSSIPQLIGMAILLLVFSWVIYHTVRPRFFDQNQMPWARRRSPAQPRLVVPRTTLRIHQVQLKAHADSWLRVTAKNELLFEGILPAGSAKEWSGAGPFQLKIGNVHAVTLFWNNQPVDVAAGATGNTNQIRIPPQ